MGLLKTCCCCSSLRTGTIIIGSLSIIYWIYDLCQIITAMMELKVFYDKMNAKAVAVKTVTYCFAKFSAIKSVTMELLALDAVNLSISVITSILLIFGAAKGRMRFLLPWIVCALLEIVAYIVSIFNQLVQTYNSRTGREIFLFILAALALFALEMYLLMVVISHFQELREKRKKEGSTIGEIYSAPSPRSQAQIIPNVSEK